MATGTPFLSIPDATYATTSPGTGNATVTVDSVPDEVTIDRGRQGGSVYYLRVPDAEVNVTSLQGNPTLTYGISIESLGFSRGSVHFLRSAGEGQLNLGLERTTLDADQLDRETYDARIRLVLRGSDSEAVLYEGNATVNVNR